MTERPALVSDLGQLGDRLNGTDLIVGVHDRDEGRLIPDRLSEALRVDDPAGIDVDDRRAPPLPLERPERVEDRLVLDP